MYRKRRGRIEAQTQLANTNACSTFNLRNDPVSVLSHPLLGGVHKVEKSVRLSNRLKGMTARHDAPTRRQVNGPILRLGSDRELAAHLLALLGGEPGGEGAGHRTWWRQGAITSGHSS